MSERIADVTSAEEAALGISHTILTAPTESFDSGLNEANKVLTTEQLSNRNLALGRLVIQRQKPLPDLIVK